MPAKITQLRNSRFSCRGRRVITTVFVVGLSRKGDADVSRSPSFGLAINRRVRPYPVPYRRTRKPAHKKPNTMYSTDLTPQQAIDDVADPEDFYVAEVANIHLEGEELPPTGSRSSLEFPQLSPTPFSLYFADSSRSSSPLSFGTSSSVDQPMGALGIATADPPVLLFGGPADTRAATDEPLVDVEPAPVEHRGDGGSPGSIPSANPRGGSSNGSRRGLKRARLEEEEEEEPAEESIEEEPQRRPPMYVTGVVVPVGIVVVGVCGFRRWGRVLAFVHLILQILKL